MSFATCDLCDANEDKIAAGTVRVLPPVFRPYGGVMRFSGPAATLKVFEDNTLVRTMLDEPGQGRVLVIDGGASLRCALVGGNLGVLAQKNGWAGIVVDGCVRDSAELNACAVGIRALGTHPQKSVKRNVGVVNEQIVVAGVVVKPGDMIYADEDGVVVSDAALG